ncbi:MAG: DNA-binding transcriptional regulator [Thermoguttaceae bacterium]|jgi:LacI family transcriptional regulator
MAKFRKIALAFPVIAGYEEEVVVGVEEFARRHGSWAIFGGPTRSYLSLKQLRGWAGDGVITMLNSQDEVSAGRDLRLPIVNVSGALAEPGFPTVVSDQRAIGRMAAKELLGCEVQTFAFYGFKDAWFSRQRGEGFVEGLAKNGRRCSLLETCYAHGRKANWRYWLDDLHRWLKTIEPPFGLMAVDDVRARVVADACRQLKIRVPHDAALIGVDNIRIACELSPPTLSSVAQNAREVGYRAAAALDRLMSRRKPPAQKAFVAPSGVVRRESSDRMAVDDPDLSEAVRYIREHISLPFSMESLLRDLAFSRRWLEYRFHRRYGCSPYAFISEARLTKAKQLLVATKEFRFSEIAEACGLMGTRALCRLFQRTTGMTPTEYRQAHRPGGQHK